MARLSAFLLTLLLFAGAIANPVPSEYDIVDDSQGAKLRRHDYCKNVKPKTVWVTRTKTTTTTITVPKTVFSTTTIDTTKRHTHTFMQHASTTIQLPPSTVTINTRTKTTTVTTDKVSATTTFTSTVRVTPTSTTTVTETVTLPALTPRANNGGKCHTRTYTRTKSVTKTKTVLKTTTVTQPVTIRHTHREEKFTTVTATDATVTLLPTTTVTVTSVTKTRVITLHSTSVDLTSTTITTTKTKRTPIWTTTTTTTTTHAKFTPFCDTLPAQPKVYKEVKFPDAHNSNTDPSNTLSNVATLKDCCNHCDNLSQGTCQFFALSTKGNCVMYFTLDGPHNSRTQTCPNGKVQALLTPPDDPLKPDYQGFNGPCGTIAP